MAVGTAALIIILSVYNGFDGIVRGMMSSVEPDLMICPSEGKVFVPEGEVYDWIYSQDCVESMCTVLQEQVFISYDGKQGVATAKGIDDVYEVESPVRDHIIDGVFSFHHGDVPQAVVGAGVAHRMGISPRFVTPLEMYFPDRNANISLSNPASNIEMTRVWPSGVFAVSSDVDDAFIMVPIAQMRELLGYQDEVSAVEIRFVEGTPESVMTDVKKGIAARVGDGLAVKDRFEQNESLYKMMRYEKLAIYLILIFVIIIIAFNIFGSLSMLIIEKREDAGTLRAMGATDALVHRIFVLEGWLISLVGMVAGLVLGIAFCLVQQRFGLIRMPGNFAVSAYPVVLSWTDVLFTVAGVTVIGYVIALIASRRV